MRTSEIYENLCYWDLRNPDGYEPDEDELEDFGNFSKKDCSCDNCFYGRTTLAEYIIKKLKINYDSKTNFKVTS